MRKYLGRIPGKVKIAIAAAAAVLVIVVIVVLVLVFGPVQRRACDSKDGADEGGIH